jgi:hypothetical protein
MMDDDTRWQDATLPPDDQIGPSRPFAAHAASDDEDQINDDQDDLEPGIASIFAAIQAAGTDDDEAEVDGDAAAREAQVFTLLSELDRLWQQPAR